MSDLMSEFILVVFVFLLSAAGIAIYDAWKKYRSKPHINIGNTPIRNGEYINVNGQKHRVVNNNGTTITVEQINGFTR